MHILYTRHDGGVSIFTPTDYILHFLRVGGLWADQPKGFAEAQVERFVGDGHDRRGVERYVEAVTHGGKTGADAMDVLCDMYCKHLGTAHEIIQTADYPKDRWFRDAWRRSPNGGPVWIDLAAARPIQWHKIQVAALQYDTIRRYSFISMSPLAIDWNAVRATIVQADDLEQLRAIWPEALPMLDDPVLRRPAQQPIQTIN